MADACASHLAAVQDCLVAIEQSQSKADEPLGKIVAGMEKFDNFIKSLSHSAFLPALSSAPSTTGVADVTTAGFWRNPDPND